jgi:hypothetical protein
MPRGSTRRTWVLRLVPAASIFILLAVVVPPAEASTNSNVLHGFAAVSASDVWATGYYLSGGIDHTLSEHWNGSAWSIVPTPSPGTKNDFLNEPVAVAGNDVWVVGSQGNKDNGEGPGARTLIEHWNGSAWSVVPSASVSGANQDILRGAAATSANDVWAAGRSKASGEAKRTLIEHWNGSSWQIIPSPNRSAEGNGLEAVAAISSTDAWVVGNGTLNGTPQSLTEHWDGTSWRVVSAPSPGIGGAYPQGTLLWSTSASGSGDVWAVGQYYDGTAIRTLALHWNGTAWTQVSTPNVGAGENQLRDVVALSATNAWAVGWSNVSGTYRTLVEHWDGTTWSVVSNPNQGTSSSYLKGIAAISSTDMWAGAYYQVGSVYQTLTEHWDGTSWTTVPSQNV